MKKSHIFILILILAIAIFFRFWNLESTPPGLYPDEATNGIDALKNLEGRPLQVFYQANNGREGFFINIQTLALKLFGVHPWILRGVSGIFGVFTILGIFLLGKEMLGVSAGLLASFFMAISFWHTNFSRIGFRAIMMPFFIIFALLWFLQGWRKKSWFYFTLSGIMFGLGFYSYIAYRISPLIFLIPFIFWIIQFTPTPSNENDHTENKLSDSFSSQKNKNLKYKKVWGFIKGNKLQIFKMGWWKKFIIQEKFYLFFIWAISAILIVSPLLYYFYAHPTEFLGRASETSLLKSAHPLLDLGLNILKVAGMFNFIGDHNWRHNISGQPELFWPVGILFTIGIILGILKLIKFIKNKNYLDDELLVFLILFGGLAIMLVPSILSAEAPHALRSLGAIPFVFIFVAIGAIFLWKKLNDIFTNYPLKKKILNVCLWLFLAVLMFGEGLSYFTIWGVQPAVYSEFRDDLKSVGLALNSLPEKYDKIVIVNQGGVIVDDLPVQIQTIKFITYKQSEVRYILPEDIQNLQIKDPAILMPLEANKEIIKKIKDKFTSAQFITFNGPGNTIVVGLMIENIK